MKYVYIGDTVFSQGEFSQIFESFFNEVFPQKYESKWHTHSTPILYIGGHSNYLKKAKGNLKINNTSLVFKGSSFLYKMELKTSINSIDSIDIKPGEELQNITAPSFPHRTIFQKSIRYLVIGYSKPSKIKQYLVFELSEKAENELTKLGKLIRKFKEKVKPSTDFESITRDNLKRLEYSIIGYLGGFKGTPYSVGDAIVGMVDPTFGIYHQMLKNKMEEVPENEAESSSQVIIEHFYIQYPKIVRAYLENISIRLKEEVNGQIHLRNVTIKKKILDLLEKISRQCNSCSEKIPRNAKTCPYCNSKVTRVSDEKKETSPLMILKLRYAKSEITKEQYEKMRKTLET